LLVIRPCDANETAVAWRVAIEERDRPVSLVLTRQDVPTLGPYPICSGRRVAARCVYLADAPGGKPDIILIATGSKVSLIIEASQKLTENNVNVRIISMPSWELLMPTSKLSRLGSSSINPRSACVEAGRDSRLCKYVGGEGDVIGVDRFGTSAPGKVMMHEYGFTIENVCKRALALVNRKRETTIQIR